MQRLIGLSLVLLLHGILLWALWQHRLISAPQETMTLFVDFISPPMPENKPEPPPQPVKSKTVTPPAPRLVAQTPIIAPTDYVAPPPPPEPSRIEAPVAPRAPPAPPTPMPVGPVSLGSELALTCPERAAPDYPAISRRLGEEGSVVLRVELDEAGTVAAAQVKESSGFARLDAAALAAVKRWHCQPAQRDGQPVRAVALQPFRFVLQGN